MSHDVSRHWNLFSPIVGTANVRVARSDDQVEGSQPLLVVCPGSTDEAAAVLRAADEAGLAVVPRGGGSKLTWGNPPGRVDLVLSTARLNRLLVHAHGDMTASAEAGITIAKLQQHLALHGQMLALDPPWPERATLGGVVAADASGPLRVRYGTMRDLVIGIGVALPDGTVANAGGHVVKNVAGYDLMKLMTGSLGTLGLITTVTIRLHPRPAAVQSLVIPALDIDAAQRLLLDLLASTLMPTGLQIVSAEQGYDLVVRFGGIAAAVAAQCDQLEQYAAPTGRPVSRLEEPAALLAWQAHERLYEDTAGALVARVSVLPASLGTLLDQLVTLASRLRLRCHMVLQGAGTGTVRLADGDEQVLRIAADIASQRVAEMGGALVIHRAPPAIKREIDVWGKAPDTLPLMRRIKAQFDPHSIMNPGRYIGRI